MRRLPSQGVSQREGALRRLSTRAGRGRSSLGRMESLAQSKLVRQVAYSLLLLMVVLIARWAPLAFMEGGRALVFRALTEETDWGHLFAQLWERVENVQVLRDPSIPVWLLPAGDDVTPTGFLPPVEGAIISGFGWREDPETGEQVFHTGVDFEAEEGTPVLASASGTVLKVWEDDLYGLAVKLQHPGDFATLYAHLKETRISEGDSVEGGEVIALSGRSGRTTGPHLHFEIHVDGRAVDPEPQMLREEDR